MNSIPTSLIIILCICIKCTRQFSQIWAFFNHPVKYTIVIIVYNVVAPVRSAPISRMRLSVFIITLPPV